ncbi:MAG: prepilin-type N-terminal cleavage/methylation domain-containing protein [Gammaproteobacteria bacterium]|nr:prepilin-type N-terminal cleavage/methylation domain-containing protein [Gammaproteobacteria bacterium]MBU1556533.1 prepilin-type N-terminal cleavage/methylation domain-containing protein [Gammaproteobacteria bacterium]MBU2071348.1 prepilin-type N-terminal cleavage/methylation domain-containing protein [Gammaproteobacteria bacterium]MBU2182520.1 prepilin-type N-terminal cleavage/methylation domain-containing protein [Gammaproteobacteria bacterium]MBU2204680.1 prepilin-type N-terminal cleavag
MTITTNNNLQSKVQQGFTLVELMIALALGLILLGGVIGVFLANQETNRVNNVLSQMQSSGRLSFQLLARDLRSASFTGCGNNIEVVNVSSAFNVANAAWANWVGGVIGFEGALPQVAGITPLANTDVVRLMYGAGNGVTVSGHDVATSTFTVNANPLLNGLTPGTLALVCDGNARVAMFEVTAATAAAGVTPPLVQHQQGAGSNVSGFLGEPLNSPLTIALGGMIMPLESVAWFVAPNNVGGNSLYRAFVINGAEVADEITSGVTDLQFEYEVLVNTNPPGVWRTATNVAADDWERVIGVRATLVMDNGNAMSANLNTFNYMAANRNRMQ